MDTPVAIKATARELACLVYLMVTEGQEYVEQGIDAYEKRRLNRKFAHLDPPSPKARVPTRPENPRRGKTEPNAVNRAACKTLIDSERRKNTQASNDVRARQLVRF